MAELPELINRMNTKDLAVPPTPREMAQFGHFAAILRNFMNERGWNAPQFMKEIGAPDGAAQIYKWIAAKGAPGPKYRNKVAKLLGVPVSEIRKQSLMAPNRPTMEIVDQPPSLSKRNHTRDVLTFTVGDDGQTRIKFDVTVPYENGVPLLRVLLDAGFLVSQQAGEDE